MGDVLIINGVDFSGILLDGEGMAWKRNDLDSENTGRSTMTGMMHRTRVATKITLDISCRPLTDEECRQVLNAIEPKYVTVQYTDPQYGLITREMYSNNVTINLTRVYKDGAYLWSGLKFPLIER